MLSLKDEFLYIIAHGFTGPKFQAGATILTITTPQQQPFFYTSIPKKILTRYPSPNEISPTTVLKTTISVKRFRKG